MTWVWRMLLPQVARGHGRLGRVAWADGLGHQVATEVPRTGSAARCSAGRISAGRISAGRISAGRISAG
ncbi:hypothetical protein, partial [Nocardioides sp. NPDC000441]|uniref:hypothetical protein n=1 Tax=Nocardioides sp. NPDC000441 TaxID=3154256 RepID=UPI003316D230